ncbi:MAG TPA: hypothetical protein PLX79_02135 [Candidatus Dojkabacteria bacterium]|nr:hypothetical protein [Candidatus Dojkabacteria bacterium]
MYFGYGDSPIMWNAGDGVYLWDENQFGMQRYSTVASKVLGYIVARLFNDIQARSDFIFYFGIVVSAILVFFCGFFLYRRFAKQSKYGVLLSILTGIVSSSLFIVNNFIWEQLIYFPGNYFFNLIPCIFIFLVFLIRYKKEIRLFDLLLIVLSTIFINHQFFFVIFILELFAFFIYELFFVYKDKKTRIKVLIKYVITVILILLISSYWLAPFISNIFEVSPSSFYSSDNWEAVFQGYRDTSRTSNLMNYSNYPGNISGKINGWIVTYIYYALLALPYAFFIIYFSRLKKIDKKDYFVFFLIIVYVIFFNLGQGPNSYLWGDIWMWLFRTQSWFGFFRSFNRFFIISILINSLLLPLTFILLKVKKSIKIIFAVILLLCFSITNFPILFSPYLDGTIGKMEVPQDYFELNTQLQSDTSQNYYVYILPALIYESYYWSIEGYSENYTSNYYFAELFYKKPILMEGGAYVLSNYSDTFKKLFQIDLGSFIFYEDFDEMIDSAGIKYILVKKDLIDVVNKNLPPDYQKYENYFMYNPDYVNVEENENFIVYENLDYKEFISVKETENCSIEYERISPVEYPFVLKCNTNQATIEMLNTFDVRWELVPNQNTQDIKNIISYKDLLSENHSSGILSNNQWEINLADLSSSSENYQEIDILYDEENNYTFKGTLYYFPQVSYRIFSYVSVASLLFTVISIISVGTYLVIKNKNVKKYEEKKSE